MASPAPRPRRSSRTTMERTSGEVWAVEMKRAAAEEFFFRFVRARSFPPDFRWRGGGGGREEEEEEEEVR